MLHYFFGDEVEQRDDCGDQQGQLDVVVLGLEGVQPEHQPRGYAHNKNREHIRSDSIAKLLAPRDPAILPSHIFRLRRLLHLDQPVFYHQLLAQEGVAAAKEAGDWVEDQPQQGLFVLGHEVPTH